MAFDDSKKNDDFTGAYNVLDFHSFGSTIIGLNGWQNHGFQRWLFQEGMAWGDRQLWWPTVQKKRPHPHEGIDFFCYEDGKNRPRFLGQALVPSPSAGQVVALCRDFLGQTIFIEVAESSSHGVDLLVLAHVEPSIQIGQLVKEGEAIASIAPDRASVPGHLHLSALKGTTNDLPSNLSWPALHGQQSLMFIYPFAVNDFDTGR